VLAQVRVEHSQLTKANRKATRTNAALKESQESLRERLAELREFNESAANRELRMIELKEEINALSDQPGAGPCYDVSVTQDEAPIAGAHNS